MNKILDSADIVFPDDVVLLEPQIVSEKIQKKSRVSSGRLSNILLDLSKRAIASERFYDVIPPGLEKGTAEMLKILVTTRWANYIDTVTPSLTEISKLAGLSRNTVGPCIRFLDLLDLIKVRSYMRSQLVLPTRLTTLSIDAISGNLKNEYEQLKKIGEMTEGAFSITSIQFLEDLETAFHISKQAYNKATMNYEIMEDLHSRVRRLVVKAKEGKSKEFKNGIVDLMNTLEYIIAVRKKARELGVKPAILENTGEKLGRARVFLVK